MWIFLFLLSIAASILAVRLLFSFGAPYVVSKDQKVKALLELAGLVDGKRTIDLGSGDGRIVIAFARAGAEAHGYEINPLLVLRARQNIKKAGLEDRAIIHWKDFWQVSFSTFDVVTVYGIGFMMKRLEKKLKRELRQGSIVLSAHFTFSGWIPTRSLHDTHKYSKY